MTLCNVLLCILNVTLFTLFIYFYSLLMMKRQRLTLRNVIAPCQPLGGRRDSKIITSPNPHINKGTVMICCSLRTLLPL